ncbi:hypothetical protein BJ986_002291 [Phycicoccus badiiscoriae]|uniref:DUF4192 domain-containing protein n=1 Tax=Pedococcus badiiscoriae TaxID=642776 RepID=A0A852WLZ7_9MICO|nr:DUF4192 domain-containing protein [Pedococcus badiiscoriae]NYG07804.1 hypothetical protein [Pedococcus badiiscoriae]
MPTHTLSLTSPGELLTVVPYILGFHAQDSIVVICIRDRHLGLVQRLDLPETGEEERSMRGLLPALLDERPESVILLGYESTPAQSAPILEAMTQALTEHGLRVHDRLVVRDGRWRSLDCDNPSCCSLEGTAVPSPADVSAVTAEFVGQEAAPHRVREDLVAQLEADDRAPAVGALLATTAQPMGQDELAAAWARIVHTGDDPPPISPRDAARATASLRDLGLRDAVVAALTPGSPPVEDLPPHARGFMRALAPGWNADDNDTATVIAQNRVQARLIHLCAMLPDRHAAPALTVLGCFTWWRGDGALTRAALARALRCQPDYPLALLLEQMVDLAINPRAAR